MSGPATDRIAQTELAIGRVLRVGVASSLILMATGTVLSFLGPSAYGSGAADVQRLIGPRGSFPRTLAWLGHGLAHADGQAIIVAGLLLLIATPVVRVAVSVVAFAIERDRTYVAITVVVLALLLLSFALGKGG
jgi:uncharacterized membrane protein